MRVLLLVVIGLCTSATNLSTAQVRTSTECRPSGNTLYCDKYDDKGRLVAEGVCTPVGRGEMECEWRHRGRGPTGLDSGAGPRYELESDPGFGAYIQGQRAAAEHQRRQLENQLLQEELRRRQLERRMLERDLGQTSAEPAYSLPEQPPSPRDKRWCLTDGRRYQCTFVFRSDCRAAAEANGLRCEFNPARQ